MELINQSNNLSIDAERQIIAFKEAIKAIEIQQEQFNNKLMEEMKRRGILSYSDENISISLISEGTQEKFDTKSFKAKFPDIHKKFVKESKRKAYVRVAIKKDVTSENMIVDTHPEVMQVKVITNGEIEAF